MRTHVVSCRLPLKLPLWSPSHKKIPKSQPELKPTIASRRKCCFFLLFLPSIGMMKSTFSSIYHPMAPHLIWSFPCWFTISPSTKQRHFLVLGLAGRSGGSGMYRILFQAATSKHVHEMPWEWINDFQYNYTTLPETNGSPLKVGGWEINFPFRIPHFQVLC